MWIGDRLQELAWTALENSNTPFGEKLKGRVFSFDELQQDETYNSFIQTCEAVLKKEDSLPCRLGLVVVFTRLFSFNLTKDDIKTLEKSQDILEVNHLARFDEIMNKFVWQRVEHLDMNTPLYAGEDSWDILVEDTRNFYGAFCSYFCLPKYTFDEEGADVLMTDDFGNTLIRIKNGEKKQLETFFLTLSIWYFHGVDYFNFYFQRPSKKDRYVLPFKSSYIYRFLTRIRFMLKNCIFELNYLSGLLIFDLVELIGKRDMINEENHLMEYKFLEIMALVGKKKFVKYLKTADLNRVFNTPLSKRLMKYQYEFLSENMEATLDMRYDWFLDNIKSKFDTNRECWQVE